MHIFVKGLRDAPTIASKIYEKDHQTRLAEKLSEAHQLSVTLIPSTVSMLSGGDKEFFCGQTGHFVHNSCSSSSHHSSFHCPSANGYSHYSSCHSCTPLHTCHFSHRHHSCHSMDQSQSHSSNSHHITQRSQPKRVMQHPRPLNPLKPHHPKTVTIQNSPSDSSSESESDSDPLNY